MYRPLTPEQVKRVHETSLDILEHHGLGDPIDSCRELFLAHGCWMNEKDRLCIPRALVEDVIDKACHKLVLHGRTPEHDLDMSGDRVHFGGIVAAVNILDADATRYRTTALPDVYDMCRLEDTLPNLHYVHRPCIARDLEDQQVHDINTAYAVMSATTKHFVTSFYKPEHLREAVEMFDLSLGREGAFRERPFCTIVNAHIVPPLRFAEDSCSALEAAVDCGMPFWAAVAGQTGATSPTSLAGAIAQANAECLVGLVYCNLIKPGHPVILGPWTFVSDLRSGVTSGGSGEMAVMAAAAVQLAHFYDLPVTVGSGITDSKVPDAQSGWEKGYHSAMAGLAGANFVSGGAGGHAALMGISPVSLVIDNDMIAAVLRGIRGIEITDESLSFDVIKEVIEGPGHYLSHPQTIEGMTRDYVYPEFGDRDTIEVWEEQGSPDICDLAKQRALEILKTHFPDHISPEVDAQIRERFDIRLPRERMHSSES